MEESSPGRERSESSTAATQHESRLTDVITSQAGQRTAVIVIAVIATTVFIDWAQSVLLPLVVSILLSYALDPLVSFLDRLKSPRPLSAAVVLLALVTLIAAASIPLQREAMEMVEKVPGAISRFQYQSAIQVDKEEGVVEKAQEAAREIDEATSEKNGEDASDSPDVMPVRIVEKPVDVRSYLLTHVSGALVLTTQLVTVLLLVYFLLASGSLYKRKVVRLVGPSFQRRRETVHLLQEFHRQVRRFLFVMLIGAVFVGTLSWLAFLLLGFEQAIFWGVIAGIASAIPYLGPFLVMAGTGAAAFLQFGTVDMVLIISGVSLAITSLQGYLLTPWLASHVSSLNTIVIFFGLLFWGWIWGPLGLIIATPVLMMIKTLCDYVERLRPMGELLGK